MNFLNCELNKQKGRLATHVAVGKNTGKMNCTTILDPEIKWRLKSMKLDKINS